MPSYPQLWGPGSLLFAFCNNPSASYRIRLVFSFFVCMCACNSWLCNNFGEGAWQANSTEITLISLKNHHWCLWYELSSNNAMVWRSLKNIPECRVNVPLCVHNHAVLTTGFTYASQRRKVVRGYMLRSLLCHLNFTALLFIYLFMLKTTCIPSQAWQVFISQKSCPHFTYREVSSAWGCLWFPL